MDFGTYLSSLTSRLHLDQDQRREIAEELEDHLLDKAADLECDGMKPEEAAALAVEQMGRAELVARQMHEVHSPAVWREVVIATFPHLMLAALFALHLWSHYFLISLFFIGAALLTWRNWRRGSPSRWSYSWLGYSLAAPALSCLLALISLAYGGWTLVTAGHLPFNLALFFLLIGYVPFSLWVGWRVIGKIIRRDWLLASLTSLPFPFLTSWVLFLNWQGGLWGSHAERMQETDTNRAFIFLGLALVTAAFLKIGPRLIKIALLTLATTLLVVITAASLPVDFSFLSISLMILASIILLLGPALLETRLTQRQSFYSSSVTAVPPVGESFSGNRH